MNRNADLATFLRSSRARLDPTDARAASDRAGLRRAELATPAREDRN
ncbi:hypothetical protein [Pseudonocardia alaniniphila]|uniref:Uncharacterized protein n=1 Tax=Pseudonocardia alaniniphila TaxID=75291 RepID=A0ABS9THN3_9PSEU|nr:hypothetical protein [Pseudonocardia alaniniphila]MCH6167796.1 hypothetical protein [Pseudonocardia alaniniphila]